MLSSCHHHQSSPLFHHLPHHRSSSSVSAAVHHHHQSPQNPITTSTSSSHELILRTHNSKSTSFLLHHLKDKNPSHLQNSDTHQPNSQDPIPPHEKAKFFELSLVTHKRIPKFPGSVSLQLPSSNATHSPLQTLFAEDGCEGGDDEMIMRAVEIRRKVTGEILKQAMMKEGKFGITYSSNLVGRLEGFVDFVMIEAAGMKKLAEFEVSSFNVRAKVVIDELNIVPLIRWLKHNGLSHPKIAKLICMSRGNLDSIRRLAGYLKSIHVKGEFIGVVLLKAGEIIFKRSNEDLDEIVAFLESKGVRRDWMGYVMSRCPQLLSYSMEDVKTRVGFYMDMGMNEKDFGTMVFEYPRILGYFSLEEMKEKVNYLKEFGLGNEEVGRLLAFRPQLMGCSIEERWKPLVKYFYYLGVSRDGMRRMLTIKPMVFCVDLEATIAPKVRFFQDIGIRDDAIGNMLAKFPPLLTYSLHKKIRRVVIFLMTNAGVSRKNIGKVIALGPELLGCSIANKLEINVKYFLSLGIHVRQLGEMIADFPMLLRYSIDLLRPKYRYLRRTMVRPLKDLIEFPRFFSYSLDGRIIPRHKVLVENRVNLKLRYMLACSDEEFEKNVEVAMEKRRRFESGAMDDSPSSSQSEDGSLEEDESAHFSETVTEFSDSESTDP